MIESAGDMVRKYFIDIGSDLNWSDELKEILLDFLHSFCVYSCLQPSNNALTNILHFMYLDVLLYLFTIEKQCHILGTAIVRHRSWCVAHLESHTNF